MVAFCADIYGKHIKNVTAEEGNNCARVYFGNRNTLLRSRLNAAIKYVTSLEFVDRERMGAIGFGFGRMLNESKKAPKENLIKKYQFIYFFGIKVFNRFSEGFFVSILAF